MEHGAGILNSTSVVTYQLARREDSGRNSDILTHVDAGINFKGPQAGAWDPFCYSEYQAPQCPLRLNASS